MIILLLLQFALAKLGHADTGRNLVVSGYLQSFDDQVATIKTDKGQAKVPAASVDRPHMRAGQWATLFVPIEDFVRLNREKLEEAAAKHRATSHE